MPPKKNIEDKQPDLEAHFADGAWYDVILSASDPTRDRFLVQAKDFPEEQEWVESTVIRPQSQPFEDPPEVGSTVLALHRSQRSDLFFEGVVKDIPSSSTCRVQFTEGRVRGHSLRIPLDDINKTSSRRYPASTLRSWCTHQKALRAPPTPQVMEFKEGDFVFIEGPDEGCWVAQLMEPYTGKISDEVDDVDDDGPTVLLRWLYRPNELPKAKLRESDVDWTREVFITHHRDNIDARLIVKKCRVVFSTDRPNKNYDWKEDELFACRTWDPAKKKVKSIDDPSLESEFRQELHELMSKYPFRKSHGKRLFSGDVSTDHTPTGACEETVSRKKDLFSSNHDVSDNNKKCHSENGIEKPDRRLRRDADKHDKHASENGADFADNEDKPSMRAKDAPDTLVRKRKHRISDPLSEDSNDDDNRRSPRIEEEKKSRERDNGSEQIGAHEESRRRRGEADADRTERSERSHKHEKHDISEKSEKPEKSHKHDKTDHSEKSEKSERSHKHDKTDHHEKSEKAHKHDKSDPTEKSEKPEKKEKKDKQRTRRSADSDLVKQFVEQTRNRSPDAVETEMKSEKENRRLRKSLKDDESAAEEGGAVGTDTTEGETERSSEKMRRSPKKKRTGSPTGEKRHSGRFGKCREKVNSGLDSNGGDSTELNGDEDLESPTAGVADVTDVADTEPGDVEDTDTNVAAEVEPETSEPQLDIEEEVERSICRNDPVIKEEPEADMKELEDTQASEFAESKFNINDEDDMPSMGIKEDSVEGEAAADTGPEIEWIPTVKVTRSKLRTSNDGASPIDLDAVPGARVKGKKKRNRWMTQETQDEHRVETGGEVKRFKMTGYEEHSDGSEDIRQPNREDRFEHDLASKWKFIDCRVVSEQKAVEDFLLESVKQVSSAILRGCEVKPVAYFLHSTGRKAHERGLTSVGISAGFRSAKAQEKCTKFLHDYCRKKDALAAIVVAAERSITSPSSSDSDAGTEKQPDGICIQLESPSMRRVWHLTPGSEGACSLKELQIDDRGLVGPLF